MNMRKWVYDLNFILATFLFSLPTFLIMIPSLRQSWFIYVIVVLNYGIISAMLIAILELYKKTLVVKTGISNMLEKLNILFKKNKE